MDIKSKNLILLAMKMNNAIHLKMQFTHLKIVNLEMFTNVCTISLVYELSIKSRFRTYMITFINHSPPIINTQIRTLKSFK